jgi:hypothetical protein
MDYKKLIDDIIEKYSKSSNLEMVYHKLCELQEIENKSHDDIIHFFFHNNCYYYNSTTNFYIEYNKDKDKDKQDYKFINENNMIHAILKFISKYQDIYVLNSNQKQLIKHKIQKKIKENTIYANIPESITIQNIISFLHPNFFKEKNMAKYFMITLGDIILKKTDLFYFIPVYMKPFILAINKALSLYFYTINLGNHYKYKYTEHDVEKSRVISFNFLNLEHYNIENQIINLICIAIHYSNRYENGDKFLLHGEQSNIYHDVYWIKDTTKEALVNSFITKYLYTKEGYKINDKDMIFLWKSFLKSTNSINLFINNLDIFYYITQKIRYNNSFLNVGSYYLPYVQNFKDFWTNYIYIGNSTGNSIGDNHFEISELFHLFTEKYSIHTINESMLYDLIQHYYPDVKIENNSIQISCSLWNKRKDVLTFLNEYKNSNSDITDKNELYRLYCNEFKDKKRVSKHYFMNLMNE